MLLLLNWWIAKWKGCFAAAAEDKETGKSNDSVDEKRGQSTQKTIVPDETEDGQVEEVRYTFLMLMQNCQRRTNEFRKKGLVLHSRGGNKLQTAGGLFFRIYAIQRHSSSRAYATFSCRARGRWKGDKQNMQRAGNRACKCSVDSSWIAGWAGRGKCVPCTSLTPPASQLTNTSHCSSDWYSCALPQFLRFSLSLSFSLDFYLCANNTLHTERSA